MGSTILWIIAIGALVVLLFSTILFLAGRYKRCPSDKILVIYGKVDEGRSSRCMHGGGALILPLVQDYSYLSLTPMTISIPLQGALSQQNIRINVPSTFHSGYQHPAGHHDQRGGAPAGAERSGDRRHGKRNHLRPASSDSGLPDH